MNLRTATLSYQCGVSSLCYTPRFPPGLRPDVVIFAMRQDRTGSHASRDLSQA